MASFSTKRLTWTYGVSLAVLAVLIAGVFYVLDLQIQHSKAFERLTSLAATQRAQVQRIAIQVQRLAILRIQDPEAPTGGISDELASSVIDLRQTASALEATFADLKGVTGGQGQAEGYYKITFQLDKKINDLIDRVERIVESAPATFVDGQGLDFFAGESRRELSTSLDSFVRLVDMDNRKELQFLSRVSAVLFTLLMSSLILMGLLVFRPMIKSIVEKQIEQESANRNLEEKANNLLESRAKLRDRTRVLNSILRTMGDAVIVVDESGRIVLQNPAAEHVFGSFEYGITVSSWHAAVGFFRPQSEDPLEIGENPVYKAVIGEKVDELLISVGTGSSTRTFSATGRPIEDEEDQSLRGAVISFHDVTDRFTRERELTDASIRAESANISKTRFLANISHEIRTPIGAMLGYADRLLVPGLTPKEQEKYVQTIRENGQTLVRLIDDLLDISKIEAGRLDIEKASVDLKQVLSEVHSLLQFRAAEKDLDFSFESEGTVPSFISTDPVRLRQILVNLVGNAIKFTNRGHVTVVTKLVRGITSNSHRLIFEVHDSGCGIPEADKDILFKPFAQADTSSTRRYKGTGLGLHLSRRLAKALGGDIKLKESKVGAGTTFMAWIDPGELDESSFQNLRNVEAKTPEPQHALFPKTGLEGRVILLVEDGLENRELFEYYLTTAGAEVVCAQDGLECLEVATKRNYDVVFMDLQMPELDGYQAFGILKERGFATPIVALTAHAMIEERQRCLDMGFAGHVSKPVTAANLVAAAISFCAGNVANEKKRSLEGAKGYHLADKAIAATLPPKVLEVIERFAITLPDQIREAARAVGAGDSDRAGKVLHKLKGTAGACGFQDVRHDIEYLEDVLRREGTSSALADRIEAQASHWEKQLSSDNFEVPTWSHSTRKDSTRNDSGVEK